MNTVKTVLLSTASLLIASSAFAQSSALQAGASDLRAQVLQKAPDAPLANTRHERVSYSVLVGSDYTPGEATEFVASSQEYRRSVSAEQLRKGMSITTTGPGAVVTLSPIGSVKGAALSPLDVSIRTPEGNVLRGSDGMDQLVDQTAMQATGVPFSNGMVGFRLNRALGAGQFVIFASKNVAASQYQLHVLDASGSASLSLQAQGQALVGKAFVASGKFSDSKTTTLKSANAFLLSPAGERIDARTSIEADSYRVESSATRASSFDSGLWELHVTAVDAHGIQRDVKTAFAAAYATARFDGSVERSDMTFRLGVEAASAGRYEASAVLYGTSKEGLVPVATSATAQWLESGASSIDLEFDASQIKAAGVKAPFTLRSVTLKDQSRMALLERIANGH